MRLVPERVNCLVAGLRQIRGLVEAQLALRFLEEQLAPVAVVRGCRLMRCSAVQLANMAWLHRAALPHLFGRIRREMATDRAQFRLGEILNRSFLCLQRVLVRSTFGFVLLLWHRGGWILLTRTKVARWRCERFRPQLNFAQTAAACSLLARTGSSTIPPMELSVPVAFWRPYPTFENEL